MTLIDKVLPLEEWQRLRAQVFFCYEGQPPNVTGVTTYRTPNHSLWFVQQGEGTVFNQRRPLRMQTGDCAVVPPPSHSRQFTEDARILSIHFRLSWTDDTNLFTLAEPFIFPSARHPTLERVTCRLLRFFHSFGPRSQLQPLTHPLTLAQHLHFQTLTNRFALTLTRVVCAEGLLPDACCSRPQPQIARILATLRELPLDQPWHTAETARGLGMSVGHFNRLFRQEFGQTPRHYFDLRRLEHAKQGIAAGRVSIKEVAGGLGFSSAVFCRWFRQSVGTSPSDYRRNVSLTQTP